MRIPPNLKYFIFFLLALGLITLGVLYLPRLIPGIGKIVIGVVLVAMAIATFFVFVKPFVTFLFARADGVFAVYTDASKRGVHVFAYHINSGGEYGPSTRDVQHYYILYANGKVFYKCILSHSMKPDSGRSGWGGFRSFEQDVLPSPKLELTMKKLSERSKTPLSLGQRIEPAGEDHFIVMEEGRQLELKKFNTITDEGFRIGCTDVATGNTIWEKKI